MLIQSQFAVQVIQICLVCGVVWILTRTLTRKHAHLSHLLWLVVLLKCVTPPIWSSPLGVFTFLQSQLTLTRTAVDDEFVSMEIDVADRSFANPDRRFNLNVDSGVTFEENLVPISGLPKNGEAVDVFTFQMTPSEPFVEQHEERHLRLRGWRPYYIALSVWLGVALALLLGSIVRAILFARKIGANSEEHDELQQLTVALSRQLGLQRPAWLVVTKCSVGPAIIGLFRTCVVIPKFIVDRSTTQQLKPIIGHELVHARRGDLWLGLFRHFARSLWWFHPLVWKASSALRASTERCCDEEVIASLGVTPTDYAKALVDILQLKHELKAIPVVPGVRPFDITAKRLERIMKFGHGSRQRTPGWCWIVALVFAMLTLPGARPVKGEADRTFETTEPELADAVTHEAKPVKAVPVSSAAKKRLPWSALQLPDPEHVVIGSGDILGFNLPGTSNELPPVQLPDRAGQPPSLGFPIPVQADGTIPLPYIEDPKVEGLTILGAQELLSKTYSTDERILKSGQDVILTMIRPRQVGVAVERRDLAKVTRISLPARRATVYKALQKVGGLPGDKIDSILIRRKSGKDETIALTYSGDAKQPVLPHDLITLHDGDTVVVPDVEASKTTAMAADDEVKVKSPKREVHIPKEHWNLTLNECIQISLQNVHVARSLGVRVVTPPGVAVATPPLSLSFDPDFAEAVPTRLSPMTKDIAISDAEVNVRDYLQEVAMSYWNLYVLSHMEKAFLHAFRQASEMVEGASSTDEQAAATIAQIRGEYFDVLEKVRHQEARLRYLLGLVPKDGRFLRPVDTPSKARVEFEWDDIRSQALSRSPELRRQRWRAKQVSLRLIAARKQLLPEVDAVALYRLLNSDDQPEEKRSEAYSMDVLTEGDFGEWRLGFRYQAPIGLRAEMTQLRHLQLQQRRSEKRLEDLELEVCHQLSAAFARLNDRYRMASKAYKTVQAYRDQHVASLALDSLSTAVDAIYRLAQAESDYVTRLTEYQLAITEVHHRKGTLLEVYDCVLEEKGGNGIPKSRYSSKSEETTSRKSDRISNFRFFLNERANRGVEDALKEFDNALQSEMSYELSRPAVTSRSDRKQSPDSACPTVKSPKSAR